MTPRKRRYFRNAATTLVLILATVWIVPQFFNAERYRPLVRTALEKALHRKITFGHIAVHLFPQPGFTIDSVVVEEAPSFGLEPFARVENIDCELLWRSLWRGGLEFGTLQLDHPSINLVRNAHGQWNIENLLTHSEIARPARGRGQAGSSLPPLRIEASGARLNFKLREDKKPFAIVDASANMRFDFASRSLRFRISGDPVRTDLELPTPGPVVLAGTWKPGQALGDTLDATLETSGALLYDWIPLVTGYNPGVYGVLETSIHLTGTLRKIAFDGRARLRHLHRWEQLPPSSDLPCRLHFQGSLDRNQRKLAIHALDLAFGGSEVDVSGSIDDVTTRPLFDLAVASKRSRADDLLKLGRRVLGRRVSWALTGDVRGRLRLRGPWADRRYEGALSARALRLHTASGTYPISRVAVRIGRDEIRLSSARIELAPGVDVLAEGTVRHISPRTGGRREALKPRYDFTVYSGEFSLAKFLKFGRALGLREAEDYRADGIGAFTLHASGWAWPLSQPKITARATVRSARLVIPGLTRPINIPRVRIQIYGKQIMVNPFVAVMGTSVFSGWLMHDGSFKEPWHFNLAADKLSIEQGSQWFNATKDYGSPSLFERITGITDLLGPHRPAFRLFSRLKAQGTFATPLVSYRDLALRDFMGKAVISGRRIRITHATFAGAGGRGTGNLEVDLRQGPARISGSVRTEGTRLQAFAAYVPPALQHVRGRCSATAHFKARGLTRPEIARSLQAEAELKFADVSLGSFDPVSAIAHYSGIDVFETDRQPALIPSAAALLRIANRRVTLSKFPVEVAGAELELSGVYGFDGRATLHVHADLSGLPSRWFRTQPPAAAGHPRLAEVRLGGTLRHLRTLPDMRLSQK